MRVNRLIHLFEGGILEKMTNAEYELMINLSKNRTRHETSADDLNANGGGGGGSKAAQKVSIESNMIPINLRALQGAFIALTLGCSLAGFVLILENDMLSQLGVGFRRAIDYVSNTKLS